MNIRIYDRNNDTALRQDFDESIPFGKIRVGAQNLYWRNFIQWKYVPFNELQRIYRRVEEVKGKTGCCSNDFSMHKLIVIDQNREEHVLSIGEGLYRREPERLMEKLQELHPELSYGK